MTVDTSNTHSVQGYVRVSAATITTVTSKDIVSLVKALGAF